MKTPAPSKLLYCAQPLRRPREFTDDVSATRARAIITFEAKWVNGTDVTYYCFKQGDPVQSAWHGSVADRAEVDAAFAKWFQLGIGISFRPVDRPEDAIARIGFDQSDGSWSYVGRDGYFFIVITGLSILHISVLIV